MELSSTPSDRSRFGYIGSWRAWIVVIAVWTVPVLISATTLYLRYASRDAALDWFEALRLQAGAWYLYVPVTLPIFELVRRLPLELPRLRRRIVLHTLVAVVFAIGFGVLEPLVTTLSDPAAGRDYSAAVARNFSRLFLLQFLMYWAILGVAHAVEYYRRYRERELRASQLESQLSRAQLAALKSQIQPHFLFNSLHAIAALIRQAENRKAVDMIAGLSDLLRQAIDQSGAQEVMLEREVDLMEAYLAIERIRFQDRLEVRIDLAPESLAARVPSLILQPLVENAITHGLGGSASPGLIEVRAERDGGDLCIEVRNTGELADTHTALEGNGVGLGNIRARLESLYGHRASLELRAEPPDRVCGRVIIPFHEEPWDDRG